MGGGACGSRPDGNRVTNEWHRMEDGLILIREVVQCRIDFSNSESFIRKKNVGVSVVVISSSCLFIHTYIIYDILDTH